MVTRGRRTPWDEDWLAETDADDLEWFPAADGRPAAGRAAPPVSRARPPAAAGRRGPVPSGRPDLLARDRGAVVALLAVVVLVVVVAVIAFGGVGGGGSGATGTTTPVEPTPVTTRNATPTTPTTGRGRPRRDDDGCSTGTTSTTSPRRPRAQRRRSPCRRPGTMKTGDTGTEVASLQQALTRSASRSSPPDGNYGPATAQAVTASSRPHGLTADGVAGAGDRRRDQPGARRARLSTGGAHSRRGGRYRLTVSVRLNAPR